MPPNILVNISTLGYGREPIAIHKRLNVDGSFEKSSIVSITVKISTFKASNHTTCIPLSIYKLLTCSTNPFYPLIYTHSKKYAPVDPKIPNIHSPRLFPNVSTTVHQIHISSINSHFLHLPGPTNTSNLRSH